MPLSLRRRNRFLCYCHYFVKQLLKHSGRHDTLGLLYTRTVDRRPRPARRRKRMAEEGEGQVCSPASLFPGLLPEVLRAFVSSSIEQAVFTDQPGTQLWRCPSVGETGATRKSWPPGFQARSPGERHTSLREGTSTPRALVRFTFLQAPPAGSQHGHVFTCTLPRIPMLTGDGLCW